jgi:Ser/Thr protein kinase RdoA (MazF antagonist)
MLFSQLCSVFAISLRLSLCIAWIHVSNNYQNRDIFASSLITKCVSTETQNEGQPTVPIIQKLLQNAKIPLGGMMRCEAMLEEDSSFCNKLYRIQLDDKTVIAKIFSPLALKRMSSVEGCLLLHKIVGQNNLGPKVISTFQDDEIAAVLMEKCHGNTLKEIDLHSDDVLKSETTRCKIEAIAEALAALHLLHRTKTAEPNQDNMLFETCNIMLSLCNEKWKFGSWDLNRVRRKLKEERDEIETLLSDKDETLTGHGDLKPSNVVLAIANQGQDLKCSAQFIDLELVGNHYRSYDLAKLFRSESPTLFSKKNRRFFIEKYADAFNRLNSVGKRVVLLDPDVIEFKSDLLLPMAWLEAAIFFICMSSQSPPEYAKKWDKLAGARLSCFEKCVTI